MRTYDIFRYAIDGLMRRQLRSWLTIIGIVIGVMAIVLLVALGQGIDIAVRSQLDFFGDDTLSLAPGSLSGSLFATSGSLTDKDWKSIQRISGVETAVPSLQQQSILEFQGEQASAFAMGTTADIMKVYTVLEMEEGRSYSEGETGVAVIGNKLANDFWGTSKQRKKVRLGSKIIVANRSYTVIGILNSQGGGLMAALDLGIYVPYQEARNTFEAYKNNDQLTEMYVKVESASQIDAVEAEIKRLLDNNHRIRNEDERDYMVITSKQIMSYVGNITAILTGFFLLVAAISLAVGSVNVANTMFMSVLERTREIGILKALGADESVIRQIFVIESGFIGAVGGVIGVLASTILAKTLELIASLANFPMPLSISIELVLFAILMSFLVGMIAGYVPARNASKLNPVEALRYE
ncbi:MAG: ABC transporter permease [Candidatus Micrarchaeota archaeon]